MFILGGPAALLFVSNTGSTTNKLHKAKFFTSAEEALTWLAGEKVPFDTELFVYPVIITLGERQR